MASEICVCFYAFGEKTKFLKQVANFLVIGLVVCTDIVCWRIGACEIIVQYINIVHKLFVAIYST